MSAQPARLYHLAEKSNLPSILAHGLMSTENLLQLSNVPEPERLTLLRTQRLACLRLPNGVLIRDQRPMPPSALARALEPGLKPADWYALLNGFVFFWPSRERLDRLLAAYADRAQVVLAFDYASLLRDFGDRAFLSPINSGNARRKAAKRGRGTLVAYDDWIRHGWPGRRQRKPAEILFASTIPAVAPYLLEIEHVDIPLQADRNARRRANVTAN